MQLRHIFYAIIALAMVFVLSFYAKVEIVTGLDLKEFKDAPVPEDFLEPQYVKIFSKNDTQAKLLYRLKNGDRAFLMFSRSPKANPDAFDHNIYGPWEYDSHEYLREQSTGKNEWTFPPYF